MKATKGMGFKAAAQSVAKKEGFPMKRANAIIAAGARKASAKAVKANPNLKKVKGVAPRGGSPAYSGGARQRSV